MVGYSTQKHHAWEQAGVGYAAHARIAELC